MNRIAKRFSELKSEKRAGMVTFITANDPDLETSQALLNALPESGADLIELGMPFSDPMADGPAIQLASQRSLAAGGCMDHTLQMVESFRVTDTKTPVILMGYFNPIYIYGTERFARKAKESGVDGIIVVDLPPEEDHEFTAPANDAGLDLIRLVTPTTNEDRLDTILDGAGGFIYYVSITGITGTDSADLSQLEPRIEKLRQKTDLPIATGFGIKTPDDVKAMSRISDAVVVGSSIVNTIAETEDKTKTVQNVSAQVRELANAIEPRIT